jgi:hypothetical protein
MLWLEPLLLGESTSSLKEPIKRRLAVVTGFLSEIELGRGVHKAVG